MICLIVAWNVLLLVSFVTGTAVLNSCQARCFSRTGDRLIIGIWLGVIILSVILLATSLVAPLSPLVGLTVAIVCLSVSLLSPSTRAAISLLRKRLAKDLILSFLVLEIGVAVFINRPVSLSDTGVYHFGAIQWLSKFGVVPGLALIHTRFGFVSSWFALVAPFNAWGFEARIGTLPGGFILVIAALHLLICTARIFARREHDEDWFVVISLLIITIPLARLGLPVSPSPDFPAALLISVIVWMILVIARQEHATQHRQIASIPHCSLVPLLLSAGAVTIKMTAFPLLVISGLFYVLACGFNLLRAWKGFIASVCILSPLVVSSLLSTGCALYPLPVSCLDLPWSVGAKDAQEMSELIQLWARWKESIPSHQTSWNWPWQWFTSSREEKVSTILVIVSIFSSVALWRRAMRHKDQGAKWVVVLGLLGIAFVLYMGPTLRFGIGYFALIPALLITQCGLLSGSFHRLTVWGQSLFHGEFNLMRLVIVTGLVISSGALFESQFERSLREAIASRRVSVGFDSQWQRLVLPMRIFNVQTVGVGGCPIRSHGRRDRSSSGDKFYDLKLVHEKVHDVDLVVPEIGCQCWAAELPCAPRRPGNIKLRRPEFGIGAGFVRADTHIADPADPIGELPR